MAERTFHFESVDIGESVVVRSGEFRIGSRELFVFTGPNGSGKTTLLRWMAGLPIEHIDESRGNWSRVWSRIGYVAQRYDQSLFYWLSCTRNIGFYVDSPSKQAEPLLTDITNRSIPVAKLSGGMRQRVAVAKELGVGPGLLLLDEPFSSQHQEWRHRIIAALRNFCESGGAVGIVTHGSELQGESDIITYELVEKAPVGGKLVYELSRQADL